MKIRGFYTVPILLCGLILLSVRVGMTQNTPDQVWRKGLDLNFEQANLDKWYVGGDEKNARPDKTEAAEGGRSLCLTLEKRNSYGFVAAPLPVTPFRGKRIRLSGMLKTKDLRGILQLWVRADRDDQPIGFMQTGRNSPGRTTDWKRYQVELEVPRETEELSFGGVMIGQGRGWMDNLTIDILPAKLPETVVIAGKVVDKNQTPVPGAIVTVTRSPFASAVAIAASGRDGSFQFRLPPWGYIVSAAGRGLPGAVLKPRQFKKDATDLVLKPGGEGVTVKGTVTLREGTITPGTYVEILCLDLFGTYESALFHARPDSGGGFEVTVPKCRRYFIEIESKAIRTGPIEWDPGSKSPLTLDAHVLKPAPAEVVTWMKNHAIPLETADPGHGFDDLRPLKPLIGDARVVGLGEATHGTREFGRMKHRFLEFLVEEMGFNIFAMEASWMECLVVNDYVLHGKGDPAVAVRGLGQWIWATEAVLELIKWMRKYNLDPAHKKKLRFYGVDIQGAGLIPGKIGKYLEIVAPEFLKEKAAALATLKKGVHYSRVRSLKKEEIEEFLAFAGALLKRYDRDRDAYAAKTSPDRWAHARQHVNVLRQFLRVHLVRLTDKHGSFGIRDRFMVENTHWVLDFEGPAAKVVFWAHNGHVGTDESLFGNTFASIGYYLRQSLGNAYMPIGFVYNRGAHQAMNNTFFENQTLIREFMVGPAPTGSYGAAMARVEIPVFFLDLRLIPTDGRVHDWFALPQISRFTSARFLGEKDMEDFDTIALRYDAVIFLDKTTRARPMPFFWAGRYPRYPQ